MYLKDIFVHSISLFVLKICSLIIQFKYIIYNAILCIIHEIENDINFMFLFWQFQIMQIK